MSPQNKMVALALCLCTLISPRHLQAETNVIQTCRALAQSIADRTRHQSRFDVSALTTTSHPVSPHATTITLEDASGGACLTLGTSWTGLRPSPGMTVRMRGSIIVSDDAFVWCALDSVDVLAQAPPPQPLDISHADLLSGRYNHRYVRLQGLVKNAARDEIDPRFVRLSITVDNDFVSASVMDFGALRDTLSRLADAKISFAGACRPANSRSSRFLGQSIDIATTNDIKVLQQVASDPFDVASVDDLYSLHPSKLQTVGPHRVRGRVLASWDNRFALVEDACGRMTRISCIHEVPSVDADIVAVGYPLSDLFHINLAQVKWRPCAPTAGHTNETPVAVTSADICKDAAGRTCYKRDFHGRLVRMRGRVRKSLGPDGEADRMTLDDGVCAFTVNAGPVHGLFRDLAVDSEVEVTGVCVLLIDDWRPTSDFPSITGFFLVLRRPQDLTVLSCPSWWTPGRIALAFVVLLSVLLISAVLNVFFRKIISKREAELKQEITAHIESELKISERTRLAIELHDSISQNLTGVALELQTIDKTEAVIPPEVRRHLDIANRTLDACRDELRYCLWDLRNDTLEQDDVGEAIRRTVRPHIGSAHLAVRFGVPRDRLTDNTTHTILRTIRELATNAVRHGKATSIRIAGSIEGDNLLFSVADNGCGFDADNCPGVEEGHYGLLGVRERIETAGGTFTIVSDPKGTKATASLPVPTMSKP